MNVIEETNPGRKQSLSGRVTKPRGETEQDPVQGGGIQATRGTTPVQVRARSMASTSSW